MRSVFLIGIKLMGVWRITAGLIAIPAAIGVTLMGAGDLPRMAGALASSWIDAALSLGLGLFLFFGAEWIAAQADLPEDEGVPLRPGLIGGVRLIGVYLTALQIPAVVRALILQPRDFVVRPWSLQWTNAIPSAIGLVLALILLFRADLVVGMIREPRVEANPPEPAA